MVLPGSLKNRRPPVSGVHTCLVPARTGGATRQSEEQKATSVWCSYLPGTRKMLRSEELLMEELQYFIQSISGDVAGL